MTFIDLVALSEIQSDFGKLSAEAACIWFAFWAVRRKYELDYKLDRTAQTVRWLKVAISVPLGQLGARIFEPLRIFSAFLFLAFLAWPSFAYQLTRLLRNLRILREPAASQPNLPGPPRGG
jgi:hypothetical protein